jgi:antirestriction protein
MEQDDTKEQKPVEAERVQRPAPRIYVASLSDYNAGRLFGRWINVTGSADDLIEQVQAMLKNAPTPGAEEWAIHDFEGFGPLRLGEYENLETVSRLAAGLAEYGEAFAHWADIVGTDDTDALERFEDVYLGVYESLEAYAEGLLNDLGYLDAVENAVPEGMQPYVRFDIAGFARDLVLSGDITTSEGGEGVYIFENDR